VNIKSISVLVILPNADAMEVTLESVGTANDVYLCQGGKKGELGKKEEG
jgi:hypothetical protein